jgi:hypothetical protein
MYTYSILVDSDCCAHLPKENSKNVRKVFDNPSTSTYRNVDEVRKAATDIVTNYVLTNFEEDKDQDKQLKDILDHLHKQLYTISDIKGSWKVFDLFGNAVTATTYLFFIAVKTEERYESIIF